MGRRNQRSKCEKGEYKSCFEYEFAGDMLSRKIKFKYEPDKFKYTLPAKNYIPDWKLVTRSKKELYIETKGYLDADDKQLLRAVKSQYPDLDIRLIFAKADKKFHKLGTMTHADWADKYGFPWAEKVLPKEWLEE